MYDYHFLFFLLIWLIRTKNLMKSASSVFVSLLPLHLILVSKYLQQVRWLIPPSDQTKQKSSGIILPVRRHCSRTGTSVYFLACRLDWLPDGHQVPCCPHRPRFMGCRGSCAVSAQPATAGLHLRLYF